MAEKTNIPAGPWTVEALGEDAYCELAIRFGCFNPKSEANDFRPPLDLTAAYNEQQAAKASKPAKAEKE
jgi:hypothetical protein